MVFNCIKFKEALLRKLVSYVIKSFFNIFNTVSECLSRPKFFLSCIYIFTNLVSEISSTKSINKNINNRCIVVLFNRIWHIDME